MAKIKEYQNRQDLDKAIANFDDCIATECNAGSIVLGENYGGCVILVKSANDANALAGEYTKWCIANSKDSWKHYSEGHIQLFIYDHCEKGSRCMLGVTFDLKSCYLDYLYAFFGDDTALKEVVNTHGGTDIISYINEKLMKCGGFNLKELHQYLQENP